MFGFQCWIASVQTLPSDLFPEHAIASVAGLGGVGAGIGAMAFTMATGFVVDHLHTYTPILVAGALLPLLGTGVLILLGGTKSVPAAST
jgi:ACS family hexuronate transporter-like MFS transporter